MRVLKLLFGVVSGSGPSGWAVIAGIVGISLAASFSGGYYVAVNQAETNAAAAPIKAAKAQEKQDVKQHKAAEVTSVKVTKSDAAKDAQIADLTARLDAAEAKQPKNDCHLTKDVSDLLNEAGRYQGQ